VPADPPSPSIDNSIVVDGPADPGRTAADPPSPSIDNSIVVDGPADPGRVPADPPSPSIDNSIVVSNATTGSSAVASHVRGDEALPRDIDIAEPEHAPALLLTAPPPTSEPDAPQGDGAPPSPLGNDRLAKSTRSPDGA
jgi:hypothetical protein